MRHDDDQGRGAASADGAAAELLRLVADLIGEGVLVRDATGRLFSLSGAGP